MDRRTDPAPPEFGPKVGWGHDAVYRPPPPHPDQEEEAPPDAGEGLTSDAMP